MTQPNPLATSVPSYIEFTRMSGPKETDAAVKQFFLSEEATAKNFTQQFGVKLEDFPGFYLEVGVSDVLTGPILSGKVKPILVLKQTKSGKGFVPYILEHTGFLNMERTKAWVDAAMWDEYVKDTFIQELQIREKKEREQQERAAQLIQQEAAEDEAEKQ